MPCPNLTEVARLGQLSLCCSQSGVSPSSWACLVLFPALRLSCAAVCAATELSVRCSQDPSDLRTVSVLRPDWRGEPVITQSFWSESLAVQVLSKIAFDVCSPLLVDVWSFTFVFHEVHPREAGEVIYDHHPVFVTFSGCRSDWSSHICVRHLQGLGCPDFLGQFKR